MFNGTISSSLRYMWELNIIFNEINELGVAMKSALFVLFLMPTLCYAETYYPTGNEDYHSKQIISGMGDSDVMQTQASCDSVEVKQMLDRSVDISFICGNNSARMSGHLENMQNIGDTSYTVNLDSIDSAGGIGGGQAMGACVVMPNSVSCSGQNVDQSWNFSYKISQ